MSSFFNFCKIIASKDEFETKLLLFLDQIIKSKLISININQVLPKVRLLALAINNTSIFTS